MASGLVLLGFAVLTTLVACFARVELCKRKTDLLKKIVLLNGIAYEAVQVRDRKAELATGAHVDSRAFDRPVPQNVIESLSVQTMHEKVLAALHSGDIEVGEVKTLGDDIITSFRRRGRPAAQSAEGANAGDLPLLLE